MGSSRKRPRTEPRSVEQPEEATAPPSTPAADEPSSPKAKEEAAAPLVEAKHERIVSREAKPSSWYGSWPRKSVASTKVAKETILAGKSNNGSPSSDLSVHSHKGSSVAVAGGHGRPPSMHIGKSKETSDISMGGTLEDLETPAREPKPDEPSTAKDTKTEVPNKAEEAPSQTPTLPEPDDVQRPATSSGWLGGWLSKPTLQPSNTPDVPSEAPHTPQTPLAEGQHEAQQEEIAAPTSTDEASMTTKEPTVSTSWFGLWSTAAPSTAPPSTAADAPKEQLPVKINGGGPDDATKVTETAAKSGAEPAAGSSWAFWSSDTSKKSTKPPGETKESGELAVTGEASQDQPEPAKMTTAGDDKKSKSNKNGRVVSAGVGDITKEVTQPETTPLKGTLGLVPVPVKLLPPNLLIPTVKNTYSLVENPSIIHQIARLLLRGQQKPVKHVFLAKELPKVKKAIAIGIHGLFPAPLLRTVIGQPTGTSIRFANHAAAGIRRWGDQNGCVDCEIEKVALEGEGKIAERVDNLWKLLLNWIDHIRKADLIVVACHSQGVPVALMLIAKLIEFGVVSTTRIGVCAMAGVSLGPFPDYKYLPAGSSAAELFEFADPDSVVSKKYEESLRIAIKYGVRVTYCGSIDDQLVSLESSIFSSVSHPYIYRAVFVDGRIHAPSFISHLIGFALKLRNLGVSDHGLIRELSAPLAGSLYKGEGHSRLYDDERVYDLAIEYTLETTSVGDVPLEIKKYQVPTNSNPYVLPWIMRGLLEEDFVKTELDAEVTELLKQFDEWKPATKVLKDVKYRLEAVRSKL